MRDALLSRRALLGLLALVAVALLALFGRRSDRAEIVRSGEVEPPNAPHAGELARTPSTPQPDSAEHDAVSGGLPLASEAELMRAAHLALEPEPERALALIASADQRFGDGHEERRVLEIEALVRLQRIGLSHARAAAFYRRFPRSPYRGDVERLTGYHPRPPGHE